jgi:hypothetical protein
MSEWTVLWLAGAKLVLVLVFAVLYGVGGRRWKWVRRFGGGGLLALGVLGFAWLHGTFQWWMLAGLLTLPAALTLGYGGETPVQKIQRRLLYGLAVGCAGLPFVPSLALVWLWGFQVVAAVSASVYLGLMNPVEAAEEEVLIAICSTVCVPFYV